MKAIRYCVTRLEVNQRLSRLILKFTFITALFFTGLQEPLRAQNNMFERSSWWFGPSGGVNFNLYHGSTQVLNPDLILNSNFQNTWGKGIFAFPALEFHRSDSRLGFTLNVGYDNRSGSFDSTLTTKLAYITVEPSIRLNLFRSPLYLFSGPRIAFNVDHRYTYQPDQNSAESGGVFSDMKSTVFSMQVGAGFDFPLTAKNKNTQVILAPFVSFHPYFGQNPRTVESWNITTLRGGIALKFGTSHKKAMPEQVEVPVVIVVEPDPGFLVNDSRNIPAEPSGVEAYPLRNYVFFNSINLDNRNSDKGKEKVLNGNPKTWASLANLSDSSYRQMIVQDNLMSKLGDLMVKNPSSTISLIGSSKDGVKDGLNMAGSVKTFLAELYGIDASRMNTKAKRRIKIHTEAQGDKKEIALLQERGRQVLIKSNSSELQRAFRGDNKSSLSPLSMILVEEANEYGYVTFKTEGAKEVFTSWDLRITDDQGKVQIYGPFTKEQVSISGKSILGNRTSGVFDIKMIGKLISGTTVTKDTSAYLAHWTPTTSDKIRRFKIWYEYNNSKSIGLYNRYITDVITPTIPQGGKVIVHGHTENMGASEYSPELFLSQANNTRNILENALSKTGRTDVQIEVYGFGKDQIIAPFRTTNQLGNLMNRTVILDIIPKK